MTDAGAPDRSLRVVLVDDQPLVRAGIAFILSTEPGIDVATEASNGELGLLAVADHRPDVVLMDVRMPVMDGLEATRQIRDAEGPPVLVLTTFDDDDVLWGAVEAGPPASCSRTRRPTASSRQSARSPVADRGLTRG